jgi:hypothetical protein
MSAYLIGIMTPFFLIGVYVVLKKLDLIEPIKSFLKGKKKTP